MLVIIIPVVLLVLVIGWVIGTSNSFKTMKVKINQASSDIDVALEKRYDTLTKLMQTVKAYAKHEVETLTKLVAQRRGLSESTIAEKAEYAQRLDTAASRIQLLAEDYPELRSSANYLQFQDAILDSEDHLQAARRLYNSTISRFNQAIAVFPASIIAGMSNQKPMEFFEADETKRHDVEIDL
jgi:LemA protein